MSLTPRTAIDGLSAICFAGAVISLAGLLISLIYEVIARYFFNAPTIWSYDMGGFLTGTLFVLACAKCQGKNENIRIDAFVQRTPVRTRAITEALFIAFLLLPTLGIMTYTALQRAYTAVVTGEVDGISPWGPVVWPFYCAVALALVALWLQCTVSLYDAVRQQRPAPPETI
jgi:TRAP-type C4-dicarboxylate transport system permease small subunit